MIRERGIFRNLTFIAAAVAAEPFVPVEGDPCLYRKELIYPGRFVKRDKTGNVVFDLFVDEMAMDHWQHQFDAMKAAGVEVPLALGHVTDNPEKRRGTVEAIRKEFNPERGVNSLFMYNRFRDPEAAKMASSSQVSLYSEPIYFDGTNHEYNWPITHVALTDQPLIPGLGGWQTIACSTDNLPNVVGLADEIPIEETTMTPMQTLADRLGIAYTPGTSDEDIIESIVAEWDAEAPAVDEEMPVDDFGGDPTMGNDPGMIPGEELLEDPALASLGTPVVGASVAGQQRVPGQRPAPVQPTGAALAASLSGPMGSAVKATQDARTMQLEMLTQAGKITPAKRDELKKHYTDPKRITFALSNAAIKDPDGFAGLVLSLSQAGSVVPLAGERTPAQHRSDADNNPLIRDANNRAAAAARR